MKTKEFYEKMPDFTVLFSRLKICKKNAEADGRKRTPKVSDTVLKTLSGFR